MSTVRFSGPTNSTTFTTCCGVAIFAERKCPACKTDVEPYFEDNQRATEAARWNQAYGPYRPVKGEAK